MGRHRLGSRIRGAIGSDGYISYVMTLPDAMVDNWPRYDIKSMTGVFIEDLNPVIATEAVPFMLHQRADAPVGQHARTICDCQSMPKPIPGTVRHITGRVPAGVRTALRSLS